MSSYQPGDLMEIDPGGWSEAQWGSRLEFCLDASVASSITIATGVSNWADQGPYGRNVSQGNAAAQPLNGGAINGRNALTFSPSGAVDQLQGTVTPLNTATLAVFWTGRFRNTSGSYARLGSFYVNGGSDETVPTSYAIERLGGNPSWQVQSNSVIPGQVAITYDVPFIACVVFDGVNLAMRNGWIPAVSSGSANTLQGDILWTGFNIDGEIGQYMGIRGPFTEAELNRQYRALSHKWGIII